MAFPAATELVLVMRAYAHSSVMLPASRHAATLHTEGTPLRMAPRAAERHALR